MLRTHKSLFLLTFCWSIIALFCFYKNAHIIFLFAE